MWLNKKKLHWLGHLEDYVLLRKDEYQEYQDLKKFKEKCDKEVEAWDTGYKITDCSKCGLPITCRDGGCLCNNKSDTPLFEEWDKGIWVCSWCNNRGRSNELTPCSSGNGFCGEIPTCNQETLEDRVDDLEGFENTQKLINKNLIKRIEDLEDKKKKRK